MGYGNWNKQQEAVIGQVVAGKEVLDLGAGDLTWSAKLVALGARRVIAVEKELLAPAVPPGVHLSTMRFEEYAARLPLTKRFEVGLLSWPANYPMAGLVDLTERCDRLIYVGSNVDGSACGSTGLFARLIRRSIEAYVPARRNSVIVYAGKSPEKRPLVGEEVAFAVAEDRMLTFDEAEKLAKSGRY